MQATEAAPDHPLPYAALAEAWSELGYDTKARQAARRALQGAGELSDWQRRTIEARTAELEHEWQEAIEIRRELYRSRPKDLTAGLRLAEAQIADGANRDALETLAALHRLPGPAANDPRIDLTEADCRYRLGELRESKAAARRAVTRGRALGAGPLVARALRHEARALQDLGETAAADVSLAEAEELFTGSDDRRGAAMVRELRAFSLKQRGQLDVALALFESAHTIYLEIGDERRINTVAGTIGHVLLQQDRFAEAEKWLYDSFKALERIGASLEAGAQRTSLGYKLQTQGELELALKHYQAASELYAAAESRAGEAIALTNTAEIHYLRGDLDQARELHEQALAINRGIGDPVGEAYDTFRLGKVLVLRGQLSAARERFLEALAMQQDVLMAAEARLGLAALELLEGRAEKAEDTARRIVEELTQDEASALVARARHLVAASLLEQGKAWVAQQAFAPTRELATTSEDFLLRLESTLLAARLQAAGGEASSVAAALRQLESAAAEAAAAGFTGVSFEARWARVEIALEQRRPTADDQLEQLTADARAKGLGLYEQLAMQRQR
ncbi:MAG: tetratricopeptide repeat protein [Acidobacteriota bacterium]